MKESPANPGIYHARLTAASQAIMSRESYATKENISWPHVAIIEGEGKKIVGCGVDHDKPDLERIKTEFLALHPDHVFIEGFQNLDQTLPRLKERLKDTNETQVASRRDESAWTLYLALTTGVTVESPEPSESAEVGHLRTSGFSNDEIFGYHFFRAAHQYKRDEKNDLVTEISAPYMEQQVRDFCERALGLPYSLEKA